MKTELTPADLAANVERISELTAPQGFELRTDGRSSVVLRTQSSRLMGMFSGAVERHGCIYFLGGMWIGTRLDGSVMNGRRIVNALIEFAAKAMKSGRKTT